MLQEEVRHSDNVNDIITTPPAWILRWGTMILFLILILTIGFSAIIKYPETIKTQLKINSLNSPKPIVTKISCKIVKLLVRDGDFVTDKQPLSYLESTADHDEVLKLLETCKVVQKGLYAFSITNSFFKAPQNLHLGELQISYQAFYQEYTTFKASLQTGFYAEKRLFLKNGLNYVKKQKDQLLAQKQLQQRDSDLSSEEFKVHQILAKQRVETQMELKQQERNFLAKKAPLLQTESSLIGLDNSYLDKVKELAELDNQISDEKGRFTQALNSLISDIETWKNKYILTASQSGKVTFAGIIQQNQQIAANATIFYVNSGNENFFGEINIPQYNMGKIKVGQKVLIKLKSYPFEEYGLIVGHLSSISDVPINDSIFISKVSFGKDVLSGTKGKIRLKYGMQADAEIITDDVSILRRISRNLIKMRN